jgi:hypothetical protein
MGRRAGQSLRSANLEHDLASDPRGLAETERIGRFGQGERPVDVDLEVAGVGECGKLGEVDRVGLSEHVVPATLDDLRVDDRRDPGAILQQFLRNGDGVTTHAVQGGVDAFRSAAPGREAFDKRLPNSEPKLREVFAKLLAKHGTVLVMSHTLRSIELTDETVAELEMIVGVDDDLAGEVTRIANRPPWAADPDPPAPGASCRPAHPASGRADAAV